MIIISPLEGSSNKCITKAPHTFIIGKDQMTIPEGYEFDGASIPRVFWTIIGPPFSPRFMEASLVHDYLCNIKYDREAADKKFKHLLRKAGVSSWRASAMYSAVRAYAKALKIE